MTTRVYSEVLEDLVTNPHAHRHVDLAALQACCYVATTPDGPVAMDTRLFEAHASLVPQGQNGGRNCDVRQGPCSCGAWH